MSVAEIIATVFLVVGFFFLAVGAVGVIKFPDFFTRLHAAGVGDTLGALLVILGMMISVGLKLLTVKLFVVFVILLLTNPFGTNLIMIEGVRSQNYKDYLKVWPIKEQETKDGEQATPASTLEEGEMR